MFRGLYCPLCRRKIAEMGFLREKLLNLGVDALAIIASKVEHARQYYRHQPTRIPLAADPEMTVLGAFRVPKPAVTPQLLDEFRRTLVNPDNQLDTPVPITQLAETLNERDGYELNPTDMEELQKQWRWKEATQLMARFLIDRDSVVRWVDVEGGGRGMAGIGTLATDAELFAAVRAL